ncbi:hypothetical protein [Variovorax sp. 3P27G3]|jgi:hypothetical protein|uniref:glycine-rich domain-containing protein n=1 Tax=Variovorax sp. 3P27G3 TaxID=2502214 RepID=UPI0010F7FC54|nr:hypothetical protein [Variovorax sp. 3P27G3]
MDLINHIPGVANSGLFTPGPNTPSPWNVPITGAVDGNSPANATRNMAEIYNRLLFVNAALVEASGLPIDNDDWARLIHAFRSNGLIYAAGAGAANAQTVSYTPAIKALVDGMVLWFKAAATNTGAVTLDVSGLGVKAVVGGAHAALQGGEIVANGKCLVVWNAALNSFVLIECTGAPLQVANATAGQQAVAMNQLFGGLKGIARFTTSFTFVVPPGVTTLWVSAIAAGAGGGSGGGGDSTFTGSGGGGGGAGQWVLRQAYTVVPGQTITGTMGAAGSSVPGTGSSGTAGQAGGNFTITNLNGATLTLTGGTGGGGGANGSTSAVAGPNGGAGQAPGANGGDGYKLAGTGAGGAGGSSPFGGGGPGGRAASGANGLPGTTGNGFGAGGGGGGGYYSQGAGSTQSGGTGAGGAPALAIFEW